MMVVLENKKKSRKVKSSKWVKITPEEMVKNYSDILREYWHDGSVENLLDKFVRNIHTGKIKKK